MEIGDLVIAGIAGEEDNIAGVVVDESCPPSDHPNAMHLINVFHEGFTKWWPASYVRKVNESR